jgi:hypothetical protein
LRIFIRLHGLFCGFLMLQGIEVFQEQQRGGLLGIAQFVGACFEGSGLAVENRRHSLARAFACL